MKIEKIFLAVLLVSTFCALAFAQSTATGPLLQISNYTTTPDTVYAGTLAYLQVTLKNSGDTTASSVSAYYDAGGAQNSLSLGDLASTSTVQFVVPFKATPEAAGGIQLVSVDVYYVYTQSTATGSTQSNGASKKISLTVPVMVSQSNPLEVNTISIGSPSIAPGEKVTMQLEVKNNGGVVNNLYIATPANSSFSLEGTNQKIIGTISQNESKQISITLASSSSTAVGTYNIPIIFTYYDRLNRPTSESLSIGPISVLDSSLQYRLDVTSSSTIEVGSQAPLTLSLHNNGTTPISAVVDLNATEVFTPIGTQRIYFDSVQPGQTAQKDLTLGVSSSASPGYYSLPLKITPSSGVQSTEYVGLVVDSTPSITVSVDRQSTSPQLLVANSGNSQIHSVYVTVKSADNTGAGTVESFIGTLNVDDYSNVDLSGSSLTSGNLQVDVSFKDSNNAMHTLTSDVSLGGLLSGASGGGTSTFSGNRSNSSRGAGGGGLGFLGGGRSSATGGLPLIPIAIGIVVICIGAYYFLAYRPKKLKEAADKKSISDAIKAKADLHSKK